MIALALILSMVGVFGIFLLLRREPLLALFLSSFTVLPYVSLGTWVVRSGFLVAAAVCCVMLLLVIHKGTHVISHVRGAIPGSLVAFTVWAYLATGINITYITRDSLTYLTLWTLVLSFFILTSAFHRNIHQERLNLIGQSTVTAIVFCGVLATLMAVLEQVSPDSVHALFSPAVEQENIWGSREVGIGGLLIQRSGSFIGSPNAFGAFLVVPMVATLIGCFGRQRFTNLVLLVALASALVFLSNSRGALGGFLVAAVVFLWSERHRLVLGGVLVILSIAAAFGLWAHLTDTAYIPAEAEIGIGDMTFLPSFLAERAYFWLFVVSSVSTNMFHTLVGYGVSNEVMNSAIAKRGAHSLLFSSLHFYGAVGLILVLNVLWRCRSLRVASVGGNNPSLAAKTAWYGGIGLAVHSLVDDVLISNIAVMSIYLVLLVPVVAQLTSRISNHPTRSKSMSEPTLTIFANTVH